jgi:hypothetical protein
MSTSGEHKEIGVSFREELRCKIGEKLLENYRSRKTRSTSTLKLVVKVNKMETRNCVYMQGRIRGASIGHGPPQFKKIKIVQK